ncbi:hypothetical protein TR51_02445 [Kitasatospora griseola]|uniref:SWIM-type domain-containing protein n=1 Tax=Kitasatospora griseola TaxID=2064 RepID=A0A0D0NE03_KITGR|nr:hypothetical protein [Kitasatospora griseola]KIQ66475.1 hypothetical protein TR51_02445 [Kitasatospora griseola]
MTDTRWPAVAAEVVAEVVSALSARLQKRLDGAAAKLADRPVVRTGDDWSVRIDDETVLVLHAPGGTVRTADDVRCGCLLAPGCLHRAAAVTAAPLAAPADEQTPAEERTPTEAVPDGGVETEEPLTPAEAEAVDRLRRVAADTLAAGISGAGSVQQAELLRTAHQARLLGLHRPAALAATVVTRLRAARAAEPDHRLADLAAAHRELLDTTTVFTPRQVRAAARQTYREVGSLRLYGLFAEPVVSATHAGVTVWVVDGDGQLATVSDVTPHADPTEAAQLAGAAAGRPVRLGDATLSHRDLARAGLAVQGATRTDSGRLGAGAKVRAVRAAGAGWDEEPVARLWAEPVPAQVERALAAGRIPHEQRPAGSDLLFLDVTVLGPGNVPGSTAPQLLAECAGSAVALLPAQDHPRLAFAANLAALASVPGLPLRVVGRLERATHPRLRLLAAAPAPGPGPVLTLPPEYRDRINLGLERLQHADLPPDRPETLPPAAAFAPQPPFHLLTRPLEQAVTGGRRALAGRADRAAVEARRLRSAGLATAAQLLTAVHAAANDQERDVFGRLHTTDHLAFATAWLAAARYQEEVATALCAASWPTGAA